MSQPTFPFKVLPITREMEPPRPEVRELDPEAAAEVLDRLLELSGRGPSPPGAR